MRHSSRKCGLRRELEQPRGAASRAPQSAPARRLKRQTQCSPCVGLASTASLLLAVISASRRSSPGLPKSVESQFVEPAAIRSAVASFSLVRGGRQVPGRPAWSARSGLHSFFLTKVSCPSGTLHVFPFPHTVLPNPSLEARPNIKTPGPRGGRAHFPPRGPGVLLSAPPQLER